MVLDSEGIVVAAGDGGVEYGGPGEGSGGGEEPPIDDPEDPGFIAQGGADNGGGATLVVRGQTLFSDGRLLVANGRIMVGPGDEVFAFALSGDCVDEWERWYEWGAAVTGSSWWLLVSAARLDLLSAGGSTAALVFSHWRFRRATDRLTACLSAPREGGGGEPN